MKLHGLFRFLRQVCLLSITDEALHSPRPDFGRSWPFTKKEKATSVTVNGRMLMAWDAAVDSAEVL